MNQIVYAFHALIVAAVPCLFGWVLLRRVVREHDLLTLIPGAFVAGSLALMALLNELRFFLEMPVALWTSYKILLIATAAMAVFSRPVKRPVMIALPGRGFWPLARLAVAACFVGVYFGVPAAKGILNDSWWFHYPQTLFMQTTERFPMMHALAADEWLYYHYGPDLLAAAWSFLLEKSVPFAFALNVILFVPAALVLGYAVLLRLSRNSWVAGAGALFLVMGGNLRFLSLAGANWEQPASLLQALNSQTVESLLEMVFTPSHALGVPAVLLGVVLFKHFARRPTWSLAVVLGLWTGMLTLLAEWYFFPFIAGVGLWVAIRLWTNLKQGSRSKFRRQAGMLAAPLIIAVSWGTFNNTYLAGMVGHFWLRPPSALSATTSRVTLERAKEPVPLEARRVEGRGKAGVEGRGGLKLGDVEAEEVPWMPHIDRFNAPNLIPIQLNLANLGRLPSWESAGSKGGTFIPLLSWDAFRELFPVILVGLPFGIWSLTRKRDLSVYMLVIMGALSVLPPVFLNWGYRSTDFLRFFTGAHCWSALLLALALAHLWAMRMPWIRGGAVALALITLANAVGLGIVGLIPGTVSTAKAVGSDASSLSELAPAPGGEAPSGVAAVGTGIHLERLALQADAFLFPMTKGRDRVFFVAPDDELPPLERFPEWMKIASYARVIIPVGRHWNSSLLPTLYRRANKDLDKDSLTALDIQWVFVTNLYGEPPPAIEEALRNQDRFHAVRTVRSGRFFMVIFRVL
jgi:hypothetical protein